MSKSSEDTERRRKSKRTVQHGVSRAFQILNAACVIAMIILIIVVVGYIFSGIAETASMDYARFYSQDASAKLNTYLNHEVELVRKMATSGKLIEWFKDEGNIDKKIPAVEEMITLGGLFYSTELYFAIHESLNEYSIYVTEGAHFEDFEPFDIILPEIEYNRWYFEAIESGNDYSLNIDFDKITGQRRLWINYKVTDGTAPIGVFCSGLRFDDIFYDLFSQYGGGNVTSYIVNGRGIIQMDSSYVQQEGELLSDQNIHISGKASDPAFAAAFEEHLGRKNGIFASDYETTVMMLPSDTATYVSIAPIFGTDWSVVTFYKSDLLFSAARLRPLMITVLAALVVYCVTVAMLSNRLIFSPFRKLLSSFDKVMIEDMEKPQASVLQYEFGKMFDTLEYIRLMLNAAPICCILWDENSNFVSCNREALLLHGMKDSDELISSFHKLSPQLQPCGTPSSEKGMALMKQGFEEGYFCAEWMHQTAGGQPLPCEMTGIRLRHKDEYFLAVYMRDLREQKKYIEQIENTQEELRHALVDAEAANRAKSSFLANMSHEIRTPMNAILGIAEIKLQNRDIPEDYREAFENIYSSGDLLLGIINDILDLSKIEEGKLEIFPSQYNVPDLVHNVAVLNHLRYEDKPIEFIISLDESTPCELTGDEIRIKQILNNLLSNAFKYTNTGEIEFSIRAEEPEGSTITLIFSVRDTGQGLTKDQIDRLFDEYTRFNMDINRSISGTGLGLSIAGRLIDMMDGEIDIESKPGKGTLFTVRIKQEYTGAAPCGAETAALLRSFKYKDQAKSSSERMQPVRKRGGRVLVVDDVRSNLYVAKGLLMPYGFEIDEASNGIEAIEKIDKNKEYDIIFMDHMMPKMNGIEATRRIRKAGYTAPIVALTANAFVGQQEMFLNSCFDAYISKPIDSRELDSIINRFLPG